MLTISVMTMGSATVKNGLCRTDFQSMVEFHYSARAEEAITGEVPVIYGQGTHSTTAHRIKLESIAVALPSPAILRRHAPAPRGCQTEENRDLGPRSRKDRGRSNRH